jgi:hypothetical protein
MPARYVAIHAHFYQPPRESPWLERVEIQDSAAPYRDWNARVTAECYKPNTAARRVDAQDRIVDIVDNFAALAFDVGPTLMAWLEQERPEVYSAILAADRKSRAVRGHGNAIAQAYGHAILPLCSRRDKATQVRWGLADFRHRFERDAAGMWLPETAVDRETLEVLAEEGVRFTLLAPSQIASVREAGGGWRPGVAALDPRRAYRCDVGRGRELALFFYDGTVSHAIAFDGLLRSGDAMAMRLLASFDEGSRAQLVHVATDGESYGHHHRFGEMALAAACARIEAGGEATLTNHAAFLAGHPPTAEARVVDGSSWSCAHGVERWRADCGCRGGRHPGWTQHWRAPLREALDWLRDAVDPPTRRGRPPSSRIPGPRAMRTSRCCSTGARPPWTPSSIATGCVPWTDPIAFRPCGASSSSATACSCTPRAAGSSTRSPGSRQCRCSVMRPACCSSRRLSARPPTWRRSSSGAWRPPRRTSRSSGTAPAYGAGT